MKGVPRFREVPQQHHHQQGRVVRNVRSQQTFFDAAMVKCMGHRRANTSAQRPEHFTQRADQRSSPQPRTPLSSHIGEQVPNTWDREQQLDAAVEETPRVWVADAARVRKHLYGVVVSMWFAL